MTYHNLDFRKVAGRQLGSSDFHSHSFPSFAHPSILAAGSFLEDNSFQPCFLACSADCSSCFHNSDLVVVHFATNKLFCYYSVD